MSIKREDVERGRSISRKSVPADAFRRSIRVRSCATNSSTPWGSASTNSPMRSGPRALGSTTSCWAGARSRPTPRCGLDVISERRPNSGSICRRAMILASRTGPSAARSSRRSRREPHNRFGSLQGLYPDRVGEFWIPGVPAGPTGIPIAPVQL